MWKDEAGKGGADRDREPWIEAKREGADLCTEATHVCTRTHPCESQNDTPRHVNSPLDTENSMRWEGDVMPPAGVKEMYLDSDLRLHGGRQW